MAVASKLLGNNHITQYLEFIKQTGRAAVLKLARAVAWTKSCVSGPAHDNDQSSLLYKWLMLHLLSRALVQKRDGWRSARYKSSSRQEGAALGRGSFLPAAPVVLRAVYTICCSTA
jgi:hypothetical protein